MSAVPHRPGRRREPAGHSVAAKRFLPDNTPRHRHRQRVLSTLSSVHGQYPGGSVSAPSTTRSPSKPSRRFEPLGPDSLTWKYFGDLRTGMMGVWIGALRLTLPLRTCAPIQADRGRGRHVEALGAPI